MPTGDEIAEWGCGIALGLAFLAVGAFVCLIILAFGWRIAHDIIH